jgi:predicted nucleic acid-binding Zn ribbon protein
VTSEESCVNCGNPMAADQEWCLECGAARTMIRRPPDARIALAIVAAAFAAVAVVLVIVLS